MPSPDDAAPAGQAASRTTPRGVLITLSAVLLAALAGWAGWRAYMASPWTRDATVRAYVVTIAPEVAGRIVALPVADNAFVRRGDLLIGIDPTDYRIAVSLAEAALQQASANADNAAHEAQRRARLTDLAVSLEEQQSYAAHAASAQALVMEARARLDRARADLDRTEIRAPVDGWVTNLAARLGDYASVGQNRIAVVDAGSFWVDGYFEETALAAIRPGDAATIRLMSHDAPLRGRVDSIARGIAVANAQPNQQGLATVNPIFTWVRLAQRIPVRIHIDAVPEDVVLSAGMTASVEIETRAR
ncbi:HlyD family secretion protein [Roseomonas terrae]|uniref:HlyD family secretion protein n=1 Tax=Neoroseomonas terrae TaxID=424799 RepID=A0ABS5EPS7_9PROT|nr:HlyD family secretion protein [Neoroseomonas terrae]MBR0653042.1 HlyD family secretion protein [Neoroseomonas terrae]